MNEINPIDIEAALRQGALGSRRSTRLSVPGPVLASLLKRFRSEKFIITNIAVTGDIAITDADIEGQVIFRDCVIGRLLTGSARFRKGLRLSACAIGAWQGERTTFNDELKVIRCLIGSVDLRNCSMTHCFFTGGFVQVLNLSYSDVTSNARLTITTQEMILAKMRVNGNCIVDRSMAATLVLRGLKAYRVYCREVVAETANFDAVAADDDMDCEGIIVTGHLNMIAARIGDTLKFDRAELGGFSLSRINCGGLLAVREVSVSGVFSLLGGTVDAFEFSGRVDGEMRIADSSFRLAYFKGVRALGEVVFQRNSIAGILAIKSLSVIKSTFREKVSLSGCRVGSQVQIYDVEANADFLVNETTARDISVRGSKFKETLSLQGTHVNGVMALERVTVGRSLAASYSSASLVRLVEVDVNDAVQMEHLSVAGACVLGVETALQNLAHASIGGTLYVAEARLSFGLGLSHARVGELVFRPDLVETSDEFVFPPYIDLRECQYNTLHVAWRTMLNALDQGAMPFDATAYDTLERYMKRRGRTDWADEIYYFGRQQGTAALPPGAKRVVQRLLEWISGYGAKPSRFLRAGSLIFIVMTAVLMYCATSNPKIIGAYPSPNASKPQLVVSFAAHSLISAFDVLVRGDRSAILEFAKSPSASRIVGMLDFVVTLRYLLLLLIGLWAAYVTGLIRYAGNSDRRG